MTTVPPIQRRILAEDLVRLRRADETWRTAACQRQGKIDPNPHQIDAVIFALRKLSEGGCILADEVGLGKTIEAGLIIAQRWAEGARRILVIVPKPLLGQWQEELRALFGIDAREVRSEETVAGPGVILAGREFAGSARGAELFATAGRFDLCVIDEAHEMFSGIHKRYDRRGGLKDESGDALTAHRVRGFLATTPVLLLTATPIQNSLAELWGLVQYVEPTGSLLGDLKTFRDLFCDGDDRKIVAGQEYELRRRIAFVCQRTLRRQAQEFLERPFVDRRCQLFEYTMSAEERQLYDDITRYLLEPDLCAFAGSQRRLLLIGFHRRMASSIRALTASLLRVAERLRAMLEATMAASARHMAMAMAADLEEEDEIDAEPLEEEPPAPTPERVWEELRRVKAFIRRADALPHDSKAKRLLEAVHLVLERGQKGQGGGRAVIFTESISTQDYLHELLLANGLDPQDVTLFRGNNDLPRAREALARWQKAQPPLSRDKRQSRDVALRLALVHEFQTRSRVLISTEAGAKGLNLQFCDTIINFDLPWNPQRIEQRIGRCHRYGQQRDVTVVNFLARDNEAHRLTFEILSQKLDLFGKVLDASDSVLHEPGTRTPETIVSVLSADFETQLRRIYERARTLDEIVSELRALRESVGRQRQEVEEHWRKTAGLIESRFDAEVRHVFRTLQDGLPQALLDFDQALDHLVTGYLGALGIPFTRSQAADRILFEIPASLRLPADLREGGRFVIGNSKHVEGATAIHIGHPLVQAAVAEARSATAGRIRVCLLLDSSSPPSLAACRGRSGRLAAVKVTYGGFEPVEHLLCVALFEGETSPLLLDDAKALLRLTPRDGSSLPPVAVTDSALQDAVAEVIFLDQAQVEAAEQVQFEEAALRIECFADDRVRVLKRHRSELDGKIISARAQRDGALGADARAAFDKALVRLETERDDLDARIALLESRDDERYRQLRDRLHQCRYAATQTTSILDMEFMLV